MINECTIMSLADRDLKTIWHPCAQMKDYETFIPLPIEKAQGSYFILQDGTQVLDAISSWWCKSLGHSHPRLKAALVRQLEMFEHVILANTTNSIIVQLSEKLTCLTKNLNKIFYASEGSSVVEIALKMSLHARQILGQPFKNQVLALSNGYHGETFLALAVSDVGIYRQPYENFLPKVNFIQNIPYVCSRIDAAWQNASPSWDGIENQLDAYADNLSAIIVEPLVQGAGGMRIYSKDFLSRLRRWCSSHDVHLIADEIMTGFGRTGKMLACMHADIEADFVCIGKGLTSGWLPMSAVLTSNAIYQVFYDDYAAGKSFLHSHTYAGNALAAAVALESMKILEEEQICERVSDLEITLGSYMADVAEKTKKLINIRCLGGIVAADLDVNRDKTNSRSGYQIFKKAVAFGAYLRPLGNTIYWLPPLNITEHDLRHLRDVTIAAIQAVMY
jgi:adenosylmethionine---8-amino-7-oxononanoate aminotransferase